MKDSISKLGLYILNSIRGSDLLNIRSLSMENIQNNGIFVENIRNLYFEKIHLKSLKIYVQIFFYFLKFFISDIKKKGFLVEKAEKSLFHFLLELSISII